jgi:tetratricopeptide (TPR) repeat protein
LGRHGESEQVARGLLKLDAANAHHWFMLGLTLDAQAKPDEAVAAYRRAVEIAPTFFPGICNLGLSQVRSGRMADAVETFRNGIRALPNSPELYHNLSLALREDWRLEESETAARQALELNPNYPNACIDVGAALSTQGRFAQSIPFYEKAVALSPDFADAHINLGLARLALGEWEAGWPEYEWRLKSTATSAQRALLNTEGLPPQWRGEEIRGQRILLYGEQGFGDFLQFLRYVPLVADRGAEVFIQCAAPLASVARSLKGNFKLFAPAEAVPAYQWRSSLLSLPGIFKTTLKTVPWDGPYLFAPNDAREIWKKRIGPEKGKLRVGLAWAGRPDHRNNRWRSIALSALDPLADLPAVEFHSLQIGDPTRELPNSNSLRITDWSKELTDFCQTAGLISQLDLVLTVDTAVAHLAGAMGKRLWLLLPKVGDWRWLLDGAKTPWYPTARLFRQTTQGDWRPVIERVREELVSQVYEASGAIAAPGKDDDC